MKKTYFLKNGTQCKLSEVGAYGFWYPGMKKKYDTIITKDVEAKHLSLWRNQGKYLALKVPSTCVKTIGEVPEEKYVCVWILKTILDENDNGDF